MSDGSDKVRTAMAEAGRAEFRSAPKVRRELTPAAHRALAEAAARRAAASQQASAGSKEIKGREGPDPTRYGDWENKGIASDF